jgi:hypothetical protein
MMISVTESVARAASLLSFVIGGEIMHDPTGLQKLPVALAYLLENL